MWEEQLLASRRQGLLRQARLGCEAGALEAPFRLVARMVWEAQVWGEGRSPLAPLSVPLLPLLSWTESSLGCVCGELQRVGLVPLAPVGPVCGGRLAHQPSTAWLAKLRRLHPQRKDHPQP